ncbi:T-complex protein 1, theta subunit [Allomyces macrogynus ATCC 38327]|uniref:CCT-theta n=1 Tax=Allomyces macrogynus (strain ATCC 38327) TaxID=578462 RepID=A0A0L0SBC5_ALLM3|nr:T-complex protein 1, theta subunit [Allomyces macrogynus ATCC 38327]|eukprot:KNE59863.1 T-complex protein 1, theta subunit [Allomyces macrogynus ATCC 38327]
MALRIPKLPSAFKEGYKHLEGVDEAVLRNINATTELANIVKTSFGPNGRNKLIINHLEKLFVTSDAATIIKELEVVHPAAKLLVMASQAQEAEMGDATNLVTIFAGELLRKAEDLLRVGLHTSDIVAGYEVAYKKALELLETLAVGKIDDLAKADQLQKAIYPAVMSKQYGYEDVLAPLITQAVSAVMPKSAKDFSVDSVRVVKIMGGSVFDSAVIKGMVFGREGEGTVKRAEQAKVAIFTCPLDISQTETKGTVLIHNADEMLNFSKDEEKRLEDQLTEIAKTGVKVVVTGSGVGELALHFMNRLGIMVLKVLSKFDLRRLCRATGATALTRIGAPMAEELGFCDVVETVEVGSDRCTVFRQEKETSRTATIVLRGSTQNMLDDLERAVDDGVNTVKALTKNPAIVAGAGAAEIELARLLQSVAAKTPGLNQYAINKFAEALEVVPRTLAENAGLDATEIVSKIFIMSKQAGGPKVKENKNWDED